MIDYFLPQKIKKVIVPPLKCQGIKMKLINFISSTIKWDGSGKWVEPFLGSGVVLFNIKPERALVSDTNKHIITFYKNLREGRIDEKIVKDYLEENGVKLFKYGKEFYYEIREQFNNVGGDSLKLLFLNRSCYNGIMRFNSQGKFNVPFGHKPERFRRAYITKIVNQVSAIRKILKDKDWTFEVADWHDTIQKANPEDFIYLDPPYIGRHTDYFNSWTESDAIKLAETASNLSCGFALSMWKENKYRENLHLDLHWNGFVTKTYSHFYHVGSKEKFRNQMTEALVIKSENVADGQEQDIRGFERKNIEQLSILH